MLTERDVKRINEIVELGVRRYFDTYLLDVFPKQIAEIVRAHDEAADAHGSIRSRFSRFKWTVMGFAMGLGGVAGFSLDRIVGLLHQ